MKIVVNVPTSVKTIVFVCCHFRNFPDSKVHGAYTGPTWVLSAPDGPHGIPMNIALRDVIIHKSSLCKYVYGAELTRHATCDCQTGLGKQEITWYHIWTVHPSINCGGTRGIWISRIRGANGIFPGFSNILTVIHMPSCNKYLIWPDTLVTHCWMRP